MFDKKDNTPLFPKRIRPHFSGGMRWFSVFPFSRSAGGLSEDRSEALPATGE
jgi:hypothetical protein